jgi:hypothetical protein
MCETSGAEGGESRGVAVASRHGANPAVGVTQWLLPRDGELRCRDEAVHRRGRAGPLRCPPEASRRPGEPDTSRLLRARHALPRGCLRDSRSALQRLPLAQQPLRPRGERRPRPARRALCAALLFLGDSQRGALLRRDRIRPHQPGRRRARRTTGRLAVEQRAESDADRNNRTLVRGRPRG